MQRTFELAAFELLNLHHDYKVFQGGLHPASIVFAGVNKMVFFLNWAHACREQSTEGQAHNPSKYYFKTKKGASFDDLVIDDLLAMLLVYADCLAAMNQSEVFPSSLL